VLVLLRGHGRPTEDDRSLQFFTAKVLVVAREYVLRRTTRLISDGLLYLEFCAYFQAEGLISIVEELGTNRISSRSEGRAYR
jgi:hypothetical protein